MSEIEKLDPGNPEQVAAWMHRFVNRTHGIRQTDALVLGAIVGSLEQTVGVRDMATQLLDKIAIALKGDPEPGAVWGFEDLLEIIEALKVKRQEVH